MISREDERAPLLAKLLLEDPDANCDNCRLQIIGSSDPDWCIYRKHQPNRLEEKQVCHRYEKEDQFDGQ